jgi:hypothetical protein
MRLTEALRSGKAPAALGRRGSSRRPFTAACALFLGLAGYGSTSANAAGTSRCEVDGEIARGEAEAPLLVARKFAEAVLEGHSQDAYPMFVPELTAKITPETIAGLVSSLDIERPFSAPRPGHVYRLLVEGTPQPETMLCGPASDPDKSVTLTALPIPEQFHVEQYAGTRNNDWSVTVWLVPDPGGWRVRGFFVGMRTAGGRSTRQLLIEARRQRAAGHGLNAAMLYIGVQALISRGHEFRMGIAPELESDLRTFQRPAEIAGEPPFHWRLGGRDFTISRLEIVGIGSKLHLVIYHSDPAWDGVDFARAELINRAVIDGFRRAHPEYVESFGGVAARLLRQDGEGGFGTAYDNETGYAVPQTAIAAN